MTDINFNIFNIDTKRLEKPALFLLQKVSNACGAGSVDLMRGGQYLYDTVGDLDNSDISGSLKRALPWDMANKIREHGNLSEIFSQAIDMLSSKASEDTIGKMDDDKINYIMKKAAMVSDATMQNVWAKIISGEAENPGKFSRRAVDIISGMDKKDAEMFTMMGQFVVDDVMPDSKGILLIYDAYNDIYAKQGVNYDVILHFQSLGLVHFWENYLSMYYIESEVSFRYGDFLVEVSLPLADNKKTYQLEAGEVLLTFAGQEVLSLAEPKVNPEFCEYIIEKWKEIGVNPRLVEK